MTAGAAARDDRGPLLVPHLDPRARLLIALAIMVAAFGAGPRGGAALAIVLAVLIGPALRDRRRRRIVATTALVSFALGAGLNLLLTRGEDPIGRVPLVGIGIYREGVSRGLRFGLRMLNLALGGSLLAITTPGPHVAEAAGALLAPFARRLGARTNALLFQTELAIRFVPMLEAEAVRIVESQRLRGLRLDGPLTRRVRAVAPLLIPVFAAALLKAHRLAIVLSVRGYDPSRDRRRPSGRWRSRDTLAVLATAIVGAAVWTVR
jgi:energy-coupling factor transporter transmembrane protein EcfT